MILNNNDNDKMNLRNFFAGYDSFEMKLKMNNMDFQSRY